jgi:glutathione S-transferase
MLTLYYAPATCALASHIALEQAGADYRTERVDFKSSQQRSPEYLKLNPKGRVPALVTEQGVLTETPAILLYIAQCFPQAKLAPFDDPWALAQLNAFCSYLCSTVHVAHAHGRRGARWADDPAAIEAMKAKVPQTVGDGFAMIEAEYLQGPWAMGERYSIADPYLYTLATWMEGDGVDPARFFKVAAHRARMAALPAVQKVLAAEA